MESAKRNCERLLNERREKVLLELVKLKNRVEEFSDYGDLKMINQYVGDVRSLQKRMADCLTDIQWVNKEEGLINAPISEYPDVLDINLAAEPYNKLFLVLQKWVRAEKKFVYDNISPISLSISMHTSTHTYTYAN